MTELIAALELGTQSLPLANKLWFGDCRFLDETTIWPSTKIEFENVAKTTVNSNSQNIGDVLQDTGSGQARKNVVSPLIRLHGPTLEFRKTKVLQQWEGVVLELLTDSLRADLSDLTNPSRPREIVEIPTADFPDADLPSLIPGCVFYWIMGYIIEAGQKSRVSELRVRRNPRWSHNEIETLKSEGETLYQQFATARSA